MAISLFKQYIIYHRETNEINMIQIVDGSIIGLSDIALVVANMSMSFMDT